jgi:hypothetical protein
LELLTTTVGRYLSNPEGRAEAERKFQAAVPQEQRNNLIAVLETQKLSYRDAVLVQLAYAICNPGMDTTKRPEGARTVAKQLGAFFRNHHMRYVADAYQNIGKNTRNLTRGNFLEFDSFLQWAASASGDQLEACFQYAAAKVAATARPVAPMPDLITPRLTFAAVMGVLEELLSMPSGGAFEQYIVASLLDAFLANNTQGYRVQTKGVHASDKSSQAAGDIELCIGNRVVEAIEVTAADWHEKLGGVSDKARTHDLARIHIVGPVSNGDYRAVVQDLLGLQEDVSVIDLRGAVACALAALTRVGRAHALQRLYEYLDRYCGAELVNAYVSVLRRRGLADTSTQEGS